MSKESKETWVKSTMELLKAGGVNKNRHDVAEEMFYQYEGMTPSQAIDVELPYLSN